MPRSWSRQQVMLHRLLGGRRRRRITRVRPGSPPGTLMPTGEPTPALITVMRYTSSDLFEGEVKTVDECLDLLEQPGVTWINVDGLGQPEVLARLGERLRFHPLAVEDVFNVPQ